MRKALKRGNARTDIRVFMPIRKTRKNWLAHTLKGRRNAKKRYLLEAESIFDN